MTSVRVILVIVPIGLLSGIIVHFHAPELVTTISIGIYGAACFLSGIILGDEDS